MTILDVLADLLAHVLSLIRSQPCTCTMAECGLKRCKRCLLLEK